MLRGRHLHLQITLTNSGREVFDGKVAFADNMQIAQR